MKKLATCCLISFSLLASFGAAAQNFPAKSIRWLVPYPAGGGSDFLARTIGATLSTQVAQQVLVDNKPGGNTAIAAAETARAPADGYTVLSADNGTLIFNTALYKSLIYNPNKDLAPVSLLGRFPMILVVAPSAGIATAKDFIAQAKAKPEGMNYGSAGAGSPHHLAMELLKVETGMTLTHVPYKGAAPALADVAGGQVPAMMTDLASGGAFIKGGKLKALAVANPTRLPQLPDVPTFAELGVKNVDSAAIVGMVVPAATPPAVIGALNKQVVAAVNDPNVQKRLIEFGVEPVGSTPAEFAELWKSETARWHKLIRDLKITLE